MKDTRKKSIEVGVFNPFAVLINKKQVKKLINNGYEQEDISKIACLKSNFHTLSKKRMKTLVNCSKMSKVYLTTIE